MKILILASNPRKDLNLDREIRRLQEVIERAKNREHLEHRFSNRKLSSACFGSK